MKLVFVAKGITNVTTMDEFGDARTLQVSSQGTYGSFGVFSLDGDPECTVQAKSATVLQTVSFATMQPIILRDPNNRDALLREVCKSLLHKGRPLLHPFFDGSLHEFTRAVRPRLQPKWLLEGETMEIMEVLVRPAAVLVQSGRTALQFRGRRLLEIGAGRWISTKDLEATVVHVFEGMAIASGAKLISTEGVVVIWLLPVEDLLSVLSKHPEHSSRARSPRSSRTSRTSWSSSWKRTRRARWRSV